MDRRASWWGMTQCAGWGPVRARRALMEVGDVATLLERHAQRLPFPLRELEARWKAVEARTLALGGKVISWDDPAYPRALVQLLDAPPLLYVKGQTHSWNRPLIAVVGTRRCTDGAARWAHQLGEHIASSGATLVSGLAMGIDIAAMRGALDAGGSVIGCLGHGLERIHPKGHCATAEEMLAEGAWITEYAPDAHVDRWHFAHRNRIVAGLASHTILVQSPEHGGGMITARLAVEYDRELWVKHPMDERAVWDGNRLWAREGAAVFQDPHELHWSGQIHTPHPRSSPLPAPGLQPLWSALQGSGGCSVNVLSEAINAPAQQVRRQLLALELGGWVRRSPGGWFVPLGPPSE